MALVATRQSILNLATQKKVESINSPYSSNEFFIFCSLVIALALPFAT